ncbi:MAG: LysM peptidoglycan-binding domain-containing protein, partial [Oscillibacter sp.]|nr:LysM peptidoglycan-binding domain-containing protein [Oscillibacter sp.]
YREIAIRSVTVDAESGTATVEPQDAAPRVDNTVQPKTYTVKPGDCLYNIAKRLYGKGEDWRKIYNANRDTIGGNANFIKPGQVFTIP